MLILVFSITERVDFPRNKLEVSLNINFVVSKELVIFSYR